MQQLQGQGVCADVLGKRKKYPCPTRIGLPVWPGNRGSHQLLAVGRQVGQALGSGCVAFIGQIVSRPGKPVNGTDDRTQLWRAQPGGDRKFSEWATPVFMGLDCRFSAGCELVVSLINNQLVSNFEPSTI
jgi:hypothetical protein